jgi:oxalate decarboxylase
MTVVSNPISRRNMLAATAAGGLLTATTLAQAQTGEPMTEPRRPGRGGSNPGPRNPTRERQIPDLISPRRAP